MSSDIVLSTEKEVAIAYIQGALLGHDINGQMVGNYKMAELTPEELVRLYRLRALLALRCLGGLTHKPWIDELNSLGCATWKNGDK